MHEDLGSRPYHWLRADYVPPSPSLVMNHTETKTSRILVKPHLVDAEICKAWMPHFSRSVWSSSAQQFFDFGGLFFTTGR